MLLSARSKFSLENYEISVSFFLSLCSRHQYMSTSAEGYERHFLKFQSQNLGRYSFLCRSGFHADVFYRILDATSTSFQYSDNRVRHKKQAFLLGIYNLCQFQCYLTQGSFKFPLPNWFYQEI